MRALEGLLWAVLGPVVLAAVILVAAFVLELARLGRETAPAGPGGQWYPPTEDTAPLADAPETEEAIRRLHVWLDTYDMEGPA